MLCQERTRNEQIRPTRRAKVHFESQVILITDLWMLAVDNRKSGHLTLMLPPCRKPTDWLQQFSNTGVKLVNLDLDLYREFLLLM